MAVGANLTQTIHVLIGRGNGTFIPHRNFGVPGFIREFEMGNFGGDAKQDLLVSVTTDVTFETVLLTNTTL